MKLHWLVLFSLLPFGAAAQRGFTCISGDCKNGEGEAFLEQSVYYKGIFKKGKPNGEGYHVSWAWAHWGSFKDGLKNGYGLEFESMKGLDGLYYPDSGKALIIGTWSMGALTGGIRIAPDGVESYFTDKGFINGKRPADAWLTARADGYQAMLSQKGVVRKPAEARPLKREGYQCLSGDCQNGTGTAVKYQPDGTMDYYYSGKFENGDLTEGTRINYSWAYVGQFRYDKYDGYGVRFDAMKSGQDYVIDSASNVTFGKWKDGKYSEAIIINKYGERSYFRKEKSSFENIVKDAWINQQADAFYALRKNSFEKSPVSTEERLLVGKGRVDVGRNTWAKVIEWDCLTDRSYYVGVTNKTNHGYLPFNGVAVLQISDENGTVVAEGEISRANPGMSWNSMRYWRPAKAGRYTFLLRFYQETITGGRREDYVDGVQLTWELHSYKK